MTFRGWRQGLRGDTLAARKEISFSSKYVRYIGKSLPMHPIKMVTGGCLEVCAVLGAPDSRNREAERVVRSLVGEYRDLVPNW